MAAGGAGGGEVAVGRRVARPAVLRVPVLGNGVAFVAGFMVVFIALFYVLQALEVTFLLHHQVAVNRVAGAVVIVLALQTMGVFRIPLLMRDWRIHRAPLAGGGSLGAFLLGITFALGWTPCIGAQLGAILQLAVTGDFGGLPFMLVYCAGLAVPFLVVACWRIACRAHPRGEPAHGRDQHRRRTAPARLRFPVDQQRDHRAEPVFLLGAVQPLIGGGGGGSGGGGGAVVVAPRGAALGNHTVTVVPAPSLLSMLTSPWLARARPCTMLRPSPLPLLARPRLLPAVEALEDVGQILGGDARALVTSLDVGAPIVGVRAPQLRAHPVRTWQALTSRLRMMVASALRSTMARTPGSG